MRLRLPAFVLGVLSIVPAGLRAAPAGEALDGLDAFVERAMAEWKVPGLAVAVVKDGEVVHCRGYGYRDQEKRQAVTARTLFAIGSISKSFTVTGLGMLADRGQLDWDRPVREYLPEFQVKDRVACEGATPRDLVTHRTGLPRHDRLWYGSGLSRRELLDRLRHLEPNESFRSAWQYNNLMYLAAGCLDERISGKAWEDLTRERIFRPLGMKASNFSVKDSQSSDDFALPYAKVKDEVRRIPFYNIDAMAPAGAINSNVEEMIRYVRFHIDKGKYGDSRLLSRRMAEQMQAPQMVVPDDGPGALHAPTFEELGHTSYGLGFFVTSYRGRKLVWHSGSIDGFSALMSFLPREKVGLIVLTNLSGNRPVPVCVTRYVFDRLLGLEPIDWIQRAKELDEKAKREGDDAKKAAPRSGTSPSHRPAEYAGTYEHPAYGVVRIAADGEALTLSWRGSSARLGHRHYDVFETRAGEDESDDRMIPRVAVAFSYDKKGDIDRLAMPLEPKVADIVFLKKEKGAKADDAFDVVILGGRVVDGTGNAWFLGDVAFRGDRIARVAPAGFLKDAGAKTQIDAKGMVVAPGFIDIQGHSRDQLLSGDGRVIGKVTQGVTTEILGEGTTNAPSKSVKEFDGPHGFDAWLRAMERHGSSINFGSFLGSGTVRAYVKGMAQGSPTAEELETMRRLVRDAMADGAFGLASALIYPPDNYVATADLIALAKEMAPFGGVYITHMRSEGDKLLEAIDEAIEIGEKGGVPVEIYHLKAGGKRNWDKDQQAIDRIAAARARGQDVGADMYPYTAGGTGLTACLPPSASADGKLFDNLADPEARARIKQEVLHPTSDWENLGVLATPEGVLVLGLKKPENAKYAGKRLSEIAADQGKHWVDAAMDLILSERQRVDTIYFMMSEENVRLQLRQPWIKIGTDAAGHDPDRPHGLVHPRSYGTYPRILGKYVRDERVLPLEDAVRKMTSAVAARLSIRDRGLLREGLLADVVVFDPETIGDRASYESPHRLSAGVRDVFVNGVAVVRDGKHTGAKPGRIVRGPGYAASKADGSHRPD
jgi:N-acyl-D-amino-acid deacylase